MSSSLARFTALAAFVLASGCATVTTQPYLYIGVGHTPPSGSGLAPQGYGWPPGARVEFTLFGEPTMANGEVFAAPSPRVLGSLTVDAYGMFGFDGTAAFPVPRAICGTPPPWARPWIVARDTTHNRIKFPDSPSPNFAELWFTYRPCG